VVREASVERGRESALRRQRRTVDGLGLLYGGLAPFQRVGVVILGRDPDPVEGLVNGWRSLCRTAPSDCRTRCRASITALENDGYAPPADSDLSSWRARECWCVKTE